MYIVLTATVFFYRFNHLFSFRFVIIFEFAEW